MATAFKNVKNNAISTLAGSITNVATSLSVQAGDGAKFPAAPFWATIEDATGGTNLEVVLVTAVSTDTFTVTRGAQSTAAVAHASNSKVRQLWTAQSVTDIHTAINGIESGTTALGGVNIAGYITSPSGTAGFGGNPVAPNLLPNSSARFGTLYWTDYSGGGITGQQGSNGEGGFFWTTTNPGGNHYLESAFMPVAAGTVVTMSGDINGPAYTAGGSWIEISYYTSGNSLINTSVISADIAGWKRYTGTYTTPANTAKITFSIGLQAGTTGNTGTAWRRLKLEVSSVPTLYTFEADFWPQMFGTILPNDLTMNNGNVNLSATKRLYFNGVNSVEFIQFDSGVFTINKNTGDRYNFVNSGGAAGSSSFWYGVHFASDLINVSSANVFPRVSIWSNINATVNPTTREHWVEAGNSDGANKVFTIGFANAPATGRATAKLNYNGFWDISNGLIVGGALGWTPAASESVLHTGTNLNFYIRTYSSKLSVSAVNDANNAFIDLAFDAAKYIFRQGPIIARGMFYSGGSWGLADDCDFYLYNTNNGGITLPLSTNVKSGKSLEIKNITDASVTVSVQSGDAIFQSSWVTSVTIPATESRKFWADGGTQWIVT